MPGFDYWSITKMKHITHCFLTHAHSDHTGGLTSRWKGPKVICSRSSDCPECEDEYKAIPRFNELAQQCFKCKCCSHHYSAYSVTSKKSLKCPK